jgi:hypothetical protein
MSKRDSILSLMRSIEITNEKIISINVDLKSLSESNRVDNEPIVEDFEKAENDFYEEINRSTSTLNQSSTSYDFVVAILLASVFVIMVLLFLHFKSLSISWISSSTAAVLFLTTSAWHISKRKKIVVDRVKQLAEVKKNELEQVNFIEKKTNEYCQERISAREVSFLMQRKDLEEEQETLQQEMKSLQGELKNIFS